MTEPADTSGQVRRASLIVAGQSLARRQAELAFALGCGAIVCLVDTTDPALSLLQSEVESAGKRFDIARDAAELRAVCHASDELLVIADGLLADASMGAELMRPGIGVLVQPADIGLALGFERLDLTRATGGMLLIPGRLLADLPDGYDVTSALTRVALQAGIPTREVPDEARAGGRWRIVRDEAEAHAIDDEWVAFNLGEGRDASPSEALARAGIRAFGSTLLHAGSGSRMLALGALILLLMSLALGWLRVFTLAFVLVALSNLVGQAGLLLMRVERGAATPQGGPRALAGVLECLIDAALVLLMIWPAPAFPTGTLAGRAFAPLMLVLLVRVTPRVYERRPARWLTDRTIVALVLAITSVVRLIGPGAEFLALAIALGAVAQPGMRTGRRHS